MSQTVPGMISICSASCATGDGGSGIGGGPGDGGGFGFGGACRTSGGSAGGSPDRCLVRRLLIGDDLLAVGHEQTQRHREDVVAGRQPRLVVGACAGEQHPRLLDEGVENLGAVLTPV